MMLEPFRGYKLINIPEIHADFAKNEILFGVEAHV